MRIVASIVKIIFLVLFILLIISGKHSIWLAIFAISFILSLFLGRFYCGYVCPMNTLMRPTEWLSKKLGIQTTKIPKWLESGKFSWVLLFISVVGMIILRKLFSIELPILLIFLILSVTVTIRYKPVVFHNKICPFGALLSVVGKFTKYSKKVDTGECVGCKMCESLCPSEAITVQDKKASINTKWCFQCSNCQEVCSKDAISYMNIRNNNK